MVEGIGPWYKFSEQMLLTNVLNASYTLIAQTVLLAPYLLL